MNLGPLIVLFKLFQGGVSQIGPPEPSNGDEIPGICYRLDGKFTFACWQKYIDPGGSLNDYEDYLKGR